MRFVREKELLLRNNLGVFGIGIQELKDVELHAFTAVGGGVGDLGVHTDRVFGTRFNTETAVNAFAKVDIKTFGAFLNRRIGMFFGHDFDTAGRTNRFAHHTAHTAGRAVSALRQAVTGAGSQGSGAFLLRIHDRDGGLHGFEETELVHDMKEGISPEMPRRNCNAARDFGDIQPLPDVQFRPFEDLGFDCHLKPLVNA